MFTTGVHAFNHDSAIYTESSENTIDPANPNKEPSRHPASQLMDFVRHKDIFRIDISKQVWTCEVTFLQNENSPLPRKLLHALY